MKRISRFGIPLVLAVLAFVSAGCGGGAGSSGEEASVPRVVATHSILGDIVGNVGGDGVELTTLVGAGEDPHVFEPSPSDSAALSEAEVVFENGLEYETWLDDMYESSGSEAERIAVTDDLDPIEGGNEDHGDEKHSETHSDDEHADEHGDEHADEEHGGHEGEGQDDHGHSPGEFDPHVWGDVGNAVSMTEAVRGALVEADA